MATRPRNGISSSMNVRGNESKQAIYCGPNLFFPAEQQLVENRKGRETKIPSSCSCCNPMKVESFYGHESVFFSCFNFSFSVLEKFVCCIGGIKFWLMGN